MTSHARKSLPARLLLLLLAGACLLLAGAASASAETFVVDRSDDAASPDDCTAAASDCTLRGAIERANATGDADVIEFDAGLGTVLIDSPLPLVGETLLIRGGGAKLAGSALYSASCQPTQAALEASPGRLRVESLPIFDVCGAAISSLQAPPSIQVGPRRADNTVPISGQASGSVEIYRSSSPAPAGEATEAYSGPLGLSGSYSWVPPSEPLPGERFTATATSELGGTSNFSAAVSTPWDLVSPVVLNAVAVSNNALRIDFSEAISPAVAGHPELFWLSMGGLGREVTHVSVYGNSVYLYSLTTPWNTGEAGMVGFTGNGRVADATFGNELVGQPTQVVWAGPGELEPGTVTKARVKPGKFCQRRTRKCSRRTQTYLYFTLNKDSRVVFTVYRDKNKKFVLRYTRRLARGQHKTRLMSTMNGRRMPLGRLRVRIVAQDNARNFSAPAEVLFKTVNRNKLL